VSGSSPSAPETGGARWTVAGTGRRGGVDRGGGPAGVDHAVREVFGKGNDFAAKITYAAKDPAVHALPRAW